MTYLEAVKKLFRSNFEYESEEDLDNQIITGCCPSDFGFWDALAPACAANADLENSCSDCWRCLVMNTFCFLINEYEVQAMRTLNPEVEKMGKTALLDEALKGLAGEAGEALDILKKHQYQGHELDERSVISELGDAAWYLAEAAYALGIPLSKILNRNLDKLKRRYPNGFEVERSVKRDAE